MQVHRDVSFGVDLEVEEAVPPEQLEHVIEERNTGPNVGLSLPVKVERYGDVRLGRLPAEFGGSGQGSHTLFVGRRISDGSANRGDAAGWKSRRR